MMQSRTHYRNLQTIIMMLLFTMLLGILGACSSAGSTSSHNTTGFSNGVVNLTFWSWVTGIGDSVAMFNRTHPNIHVTVLNVGSGPTEYNKLYTAIKANNAPDLGQVEYQLLPTFETTGGLLDMAPYGADAVKRQFIPWTWSQVSIGNAVYAIPQDTGPLAMYYRTDVFQKYHLPIPTTWQQFAADAVKLHAANPNEYITDFPAREPGWFSGLIWQAGGHLFSIQNGQSWNVSLNSPQAMKVATYWQGLLNAKDVKTEPDFTDGWYHDLQSGSIATWFSAAWGAGTLTANAALSAGKWRVVPMPQWQAGQNIDGNWGGSSTVVFKDTQHPKEATEFATWLNTNAQSVDNMIKQQSIYPANEPALNSPLVNGGQPFFGNQKIYTVFKNGSNQVNPDFQWGPTIN